MQKDAIKLMAQNGKIAAQKLLALTTKEKNLILKKMADALAQYREKIKAANKKDLALARKNNLSAALLDRLTLTDARIDVMVQSFYDIIKLKDPIDDVLEQFKNKNGLIIKKVRVPIGLIGVIYESRPNVTADVIALTLKTANAIILKGGSEAINSNKAILRAIFFGAKNTNLPKHAIQLITTSDRNAISELVQLTGIVDLIIPRGGEDLINAVTKMARVPVIKHYKGVCHVYVDKDADINKAIKICVNAKCQRPGVCNAMETLLVQHDIAKKFLPQVAVCFKAQNVLLKGDDKVRKIILDAALATEDDWYAEYLGLVLAIKIVKDVNEAVTHINHYGSHHSDAIVSENRAAQKYFTQQVDSAAVYVNASTRFTDGVEFGMGAEIGISTDKLHARGPMGLNELTTYKYVVLGNGQVRK